MKFGVTAVCGLLIGLGLGLVYTWWWAPVAYANIRPDSLGADAQAQYVRWIAAAYAVDQDGVRAEARVRTLGAGEPAARVAALAQQWAAQGQDPQEVQALARLAAVLGAGPVTVTPGPSPTPTVTPTPTETPTPTATPRPTITPIPLPTHPPTVTPIGVLMLSSQQLVCPPRSSPPLLEVLALDGVGKPVPGLEVWVEWNGGFDRFFTGLKPEMGTGYGDFAMTPGTTYTVRLALAPGQVVADLTPPDCTDTVTGQTYPGSWLLTFRGQ